jgi:hypothetical protein
MVYNTQDCLFLDFVHRPEFQITANTTFRKLDLFASSSERKETPALFGPLERANLNNWKKFSIYLEFRTLVKVHKPSDFK